MAQFIQSLFLDPLGVFFVFFMSFIMHLYRRLNIFGMSGISMDEIPLTI